MSDDQHGPGHGQEDGQGQGAPQGGGRWDPLPQGDYDDGATAFVKLPEGGIDAFLAARGDSPLAAPGHGYVPPQIAVAPPTDGTGTWAAPAGGSDWPAPQDTPQTVGDDRFTYHPGATGQWVFEDTSGSSGAPGAAPGHDVTGQWSIPVAGGDLPDESGEFTTSSLVEQWGGTPPATLPGGASAPWATEPAGPADHGVPDRTWAQHTDETGPAARPATELPDFGHPQEHGPAAADPGRRHPGDEHGGQHAHPNGTFAPEISAEAYTVAPGRSPETAGRDAQRAAEADGSAGAPAGAEDAHEAAHEPAEAAHGPAEPSDGPADPHGALPGPDEAPEDRSAAAGTAHEPEADDAPGAADPRSPEAAGPDGAAEEPDDAPAPFHEEHPLAGYTLRVNGSDRPVTDAWIGESLLYVLRERLGLAGAKDGCSQGECGACNVQVDGRLVASCLVPAVTTAGSEIRTVEGLAVDGQPSDVQRALARCGAVQCGFCVPGMAMTVHDLLEGNPAPTELEARQALCGNLCRCSGYRGVLRAVQDVVAEREAVADAETDGDEARIPHQAGPGAGGVHPSAFENPAQPHPHDPAYGQGQDGGQA
ncbi:aerobic-type carbon monoxide dehydrogenase small subunit (CoxS/CutS family) [Streptomyces sp. 3330]|uniref:2Fe-2S iron-sulfur cluster-binding protein n=1 Tax=Streptomyces sp. 3330 TaxID=2817755 RepID=UPI002856C38B|nr:2Fe-2S iron-sulfur cluster-binding protein [Streptomyces sp. 3330]MDR6978497.1 aerobic-type carbon monoxide dehydrogenase small subunit (CoxS/CutS family) [Streptomyces sp. 3330]